MAGRPIKQSIIWKLAVDNRRFDNHVYKKWVTNFSKGAKWPPERFLIPGDKNVTIQNLKRAYHSHKTKPEYRALLLHSLFEPMDWVTNQYNALRKAEGNTIDKMGLQIRFQNGEYYLRLTNIELSPIKLNALIKEGIKHRHIRANPSVRYLKALTSSGVKQQKVALWADEFNRCLVTIAEQIVTTIYLTDPINKFGSPPSYGEEPLPETKETGSIEDKITKYLKDNEGVLENIKSQLGGYLNIANSLGIDTSTILGQVDELLLQIKDYNSLEYHREDLLYECHETGRDLVESLYRITAQVDAIDLDDPRINRVHKSSIIPTFKDTTARVKFHRDMTSKGASQGIKNYATQMLKKTNWEFYDN